MENAPVAQAPKCFECPEGYSANLNNTCVRNVYPTTSTPDGSLEFDDSNPVYNGNTSIRLVSGEGACLDAMSGRVEVNFNTLSDLSMFQGITEFSNKTWFTINDINFGILAAENICKYDYVFI